MNLYTDVIIYFIKAFIMNMSAFYSMKKILNIKKIRLNLKNMTILVSLNIIIAILSTYLEFGWNKFLSTITIFFLDSVILGIYIKRKITYSLIIVLISYAICAICLVVSVIIEFFIYKIVNVNNNYLNLVIILILQYIFVYSLFKIKRFKNGFDFLNKKINEELTDSIMINISVIIIVVYCLLGSIFEEIKKNLLIAFIFLTISMIIMIQKTLKIYYKQNLLEDTLKEYKNEVEEKNEEINKLKEEKFSISKITHEFYNRQKALELLVTENIKNENDITKDNTNKKILETIQNITNEYTKKLEKVKTPSKLEITDIPEIDAMFKYMQNECSKNKIEFKLKIIGKIYPLINNIIPKNKLETLIGDHIRDAINAASSTKTENKEILTIIGIKENNYELSILDTGVEFEIDTLIKLGKEPVTTYQGRGGSGIGFLTTFETMKDTGASFVITEFMPTKQRFYTKSVTIKFDGKNEYKICSYRAEEIEKRATNDNRIIIEKIQE
ncbi:MAG: hypothetical protein IJV31_10190 [Clostridia bacterium]|nr:hypothetical protein [Clostridia bacterium]